MCMCVSKWLLPSLPLLLQDRASIKSRSLEQLGDWQQPLSPAHEVRDPIGALVKQAVEQ